MPESFFCDIIIQQVWKRPHGQAVKTSPSHGENRGSSPRGATKSVLHELLFFQRRFRFYGSIVIRKKARFSLPFCFPLEWKKFVWRCGDVDRAFLKRYSSLYFCDGAAKVRSPCGAWGSSPNEARRSARQAACRLRTSPFSPKFLPIFSTPARRFKNLRQAQIFEKMRSYLTTELTR